MPLDASARWCALHRLAGKPTDVVLVLSSQVMECCSCDECRDARDVLSVGLRRFCRGRVFSFDSVFRGAALLGSHCTPGRKRWEPMRANAFLLPIFLLTCAGCATITTDAGQSLRVETFTDTGEEVKGAQCRLENDNGTYFVMTPGAVTVRKSSGDMRVNCTSPGQQDAKATVTSRVGAGMFGNIIFGGGVGAVIDHAKGTAYNYPTWLQLVFGRLLSFDRSDYVEGKPNLAFEAKDGKRQAYIRPNPAPADPAAGLPSK